ncbi:Histidine kinase/HSP90-like ATPase [Trypanosoma melophagium]|uniref:Histidine kinase/HSP90-like ATPase n=1 Tax=Trypanosoma melophagium TaxID=715481 RepID=UPI00351AAB3E|nr:Histidine kinase/HSP90-like ATPase [Trypanosoma melophagium]
MRWHSSGVLLKHSEQALERFLNTPLHPMNVRKMMGGNREQIGAAVEQLGARTARSYRAFSNDVIKRSLDGETSLRLQSLESICKREFDLCVSLSEAAEIYLSDLKRGEISDDDTLLPNEISDDASVDNIMRGKISSSDSSQARFIDALENLRPHENMLEVVVNEECIRSPVLNTWLSCFCRRRVSWRVIHEHLLHLVGPRRYPSVIREDHEMGGILEHACTVVIELYSRVVQAVCGGSLMITVDERPELLTQAPQWPLLTSSSDVAPFVPLDLLPTPQLSECVYSVEGHLEYVFRELIKNACVARLKQTLDVELQVNFALSDTHVVVDVTDKAGGISPEAVKDIWLFGWTTNTSLGNPMGGFGVGLPASKVYMDLWGGRIDLHTRVGEGTTVRVTFPKSPIEVLLP